MLEQTKQRESVSQLLKNVTAVEKYMKYMLTNKTEGEYVTAVEKYMNKQNRGGRVCYSC